VSAQNQTEVRLLSDSEAANLYLDLALPEGQSRPYTVTNTAESVDGRTALAGSSQGIGSATDRRLLRRVRAAAEAVLLGANTLQAEEVPFQFPADLMDNRLRHGLPHELLVVLITAGSTPLPLHRRLFAKPSPDVVPLVLTSRQAELALGQQLAGRAPVLAVGETEVDLPAALRRLRQTYGVRRLVVEGGPRLNGALLAAELVDEVFLTLAPRLLGGTSPGAVAGELAESRQRPLALLSALAYRGELFLRYRVCHGSPA
jgi:2,5-diamino-6-(ribosylamino)-4(3H)-pyrimidinone 5'-phosphate reductase